MCGNAYLCSDIDLRVTDFNPLFGSHSFVIVGGFRFHVCVA
jgi:hypothetical protein